MFDFENVSLFLNSSPIGSPAAPKDAEYPFSTKAFSPDTVVFDMVTKQTQLLLDAESLGAKTVPGLRMLLHQAVPQFQRFTGRSERPLAVMEKALTARQREDEK